MRLIFVICVSLLFSAPIYAGEWTTDTKSGCTVWSPNQLPNDTVSYSGECSDGKADGNGTVTFESGKNSMHLKGIFDNGKPQGNVLLTLYQSGSRISDFQGSINNDFLPHGGGSTTVYKNGETSVLFVGKFKNGKAYGEGSLSSFHHGKIVTNYSGEFAEDGPSESGKGSTTLYKDGKVIKNVKGEYINAGKGTGTITWYKNEIESRHYKGEVKGIDPHGEGTEIDEEGNKYSGSWQNGKKHGKGKYTFSDGNSYKGLWENDKRIKIF